MAPTTGIPGPATTSALSERFLELTTDIAAAVGFDGRLVGANPAFTRVGGATVGDRAGANAHELLHPEDRTALGACWAELVAGARDSAAIEVRLGRRARGAAGSCSASSSTARRSSSASWARTSTSSARPPTA